MSNVRPPRPSESLGDHPNIEQLFKLTPRRWGMAFKREFAGVVADESAVRLGEPNCGEPSSPPQDIVSPGTVVIAGPDDVPFRRNVVPGVGVVADEGDSHGPVEAVRPVTRSVSERATDKAPQRP